MGLETAPFEEIAATGDLAAESSRFAQVLAGKNHAACTAFTCLNAGAVLYIAERVPTIRQGVELSRETIANGSALRKLEDWVSVQNMDSKQGLKRFEQALRDAGL